MSLGIGRGVGPRRGGPGPAGLGAGGGAPSLVVRILTTAALLSCLAWIPARLRAQEHQDHARPASAVQAEGQVGHAVDVEAARELVRRRSADGVVRSYRVGGAGGLPTLADAVRRSGAGDTIVIRPGVYTERVRIGHPIVLVGEEGAVLDGGGEGSVLVLDLAPGSLVRGLTIRGSGRNLAREDSGILASRSPGIRIESCVLEDVLFGIYVKESAEARVLDNEVTGHDLDVANRGDAIRLWYSAGGLVERNRIRRARDVVIWFSDSVELRENEVEGSRYGLHYMYSDHGRFHGNRFMGNLVGGFLMYSTDLRFADNVFDSSRGATGMGLGLKDTDEVDARRNTFVGNAVGVYLDNSPQTVGARNHFEGNVIARNEVGVSLLPSVRDNDFEGNTFEANIREVVVSGGGNALENHWAGNYWSRYAGFDQNHDGVGDTPFVASRLSDRLLTSYPELEVFALSPAAAALDVLARVLPFLEPQPVVVDSVPRSEPAAELDVAASGGDGRKGLWVAAGLLLLTGVLGGAGLKGRHFHPARRASDEASGESTEPAG